MEENIIQATRREIIGKHVKASRKEGKLPAVIYGRHIESTPIWLDLRDATKTLASMQVSSLVTIDLGDAKHLTLVREKQRNYLTGMLLHIDFQAVSLLEKLRTDVTVVVHGESPAVKNLNGVLVMNMDSLEVECLPQYLPEQIMVDISALQTIGQSILVKDIAVMEFVEILNDPEDVILVVTAQEAEEEEEAVPVEGEPEILVKGKEEEEEED
jgi:large subunit ribosomal protein L25